MPIERGVWVVASSFGRDSRCRDARRPWTRACEAQDGYRPPIRRPPAPGPRPDGPGTSPRRRSDEVAGFELKAGAVFLDATAGKWDCPAADPRRAPGRCCFPGRLPGRQCTAPRSRGPVPPRPLPRPQSPRSSCSRCTSPAGTAVSDTSLSGSPRNATRASADKPTATSGSPRRIASRPSATSPATRSASTSTWSRSSRYPPPRSTIAARSSARRSRAICPCIDLRADGGRPLRPQCLLQHVHGHPLTNPRRQCSEHCPFRSRQTNDRRGRRTPPPSQGVGGHQDLPTDGQEALPTGGHDVGERSVVEMAPLPGSALVGWFRCLTAAVRGRAIRTSPTESPRDPGAVVGAAVRHRNDARVVRRHSRVGALLCPETAGSRLRVVHELPHLLRAPAAHGEACRPPQCSVA